MVDVAKLTISVDSRGVVRARNELGRFTKAGVAATAGAGAVGKAATGAAVGFGRLTTSLKTAAIALGPLAAFASLVGTFGKLVSANRDFGLAMATTKGVLSSTITDVSLLEETMVSLSASAREAGATTRFTAGQAADAQLKLARAGLSSAKAIDDALIPTLNLAIVAQIDLADSAKLVTKTLAQFGLGTEDAARVTDVLTLASNRTNNEVAELGEAFKLVGPIAKSAGISFEETAAALGVLGNNGLNATLGGTSLRATITQLAKPTGRAAAALDELIRSSGQSGDSFDVVKKKITGVFEALDQAGAGFGDLNEIFAVRALAGANILTSSTDQTRKLFLALQDAGGAAQKMADIMQDTLDGSLRNVASAFEAVLLTMGIEGGFNGALRTALGHLTGFLRALSGMEAGVNGVTPGMARLADVMKTLAGVFGAIVGSKMLTFLARFLLKLNPITAIVSTLIALWVRFGDEMVTIGGTTATVTEFIRATFLAMGQKIEAIFSTVLAVGTFLWEKLSSVFNAGVNAILEPFRFFGITIVDVFNAAFETVKSVLFSALDIIAAAINTVFQGIVRRGTDAFKALAAVDLGSPIESANRILAALNPVAQIQKDIDQFELSLEKKLVSTFVEDMASALPTIQAELGRWLDRIFGDGFADQLDLAFNPLRFFEQIAQNVQDAQVPTAPDRPGSPTAEGVLGEVGQIAPEVADASEALQDLDRLSERWADSFANSLTDIITEVDSLQDAFKNLFEEISRIAIQELVAAPFRSFLQDTFGNILGANSTGPGTGNTSQGTFTQPVQTTATGGSFAQFEALGNAYSNGSVVPFARGGIVHSPTTFGLANGQRGLMGEQGPEAIMPLERGPDGALGIRGGNGGNVTVNQTFIGGVDGYRRNRRQMARDQQAAVRRS